ncbi:MAG: response regulator, partial [Deltaproteobacteria bacterium]
MLGEIPIKVLFVDDEENILKALRRLLIDEEDMEVFTASSGEEGLKILESEPDIGVIVSDQRMPGLSGVDFLEKAKKIAPHSVRIVLTGYADVHAAVDAINRGGAYRYVSKPWKDEELLQIIRDAASRYRLIVENRRLIQIINQQNRELKSWNEKLEARVKEQTE